MLHSKSSHLYSIRLRSGHCETHSYALHYRHPYEMAHRFKGISLSDISQNDLNGYQIVLN